MNGCKCFDPNDEDGVCIKKDREWVGLTKAEFNEATNNLEDLEDCWIAIEAKLKEKNNG